MLHLRDARGVVVLMDECKYEKMAHDGDEQPLRSRVLSPLSELGQHVANIPFDPPPPPPVSLCRLWFNGKGIFNGSPIAHQRLGHHQSPRTKGGRFHGAISNIWEGLPVLPASHARFAVVDRVDGADVPQLEAIYLAIAVGLLGGVSHDPDCDQIVGSDTVREGWGWSWSGWSRSDSKVVEISRQLWDMGNWIAF